MTGVLLILTIGVVVLAIAALADWRSAKRAERAMLQAPETPAASERDTPLPTPDYVSAQQAHLSQVSPSVLTDEQTAQLTEDGGIEITAQVVDDRFKTHTERDAMVLFGARVLCSPEGIGTLREVLQTLERSAQDKTPIVLVTPTVDPEVADTTVVNVLQGVITGGIITASAGDCVSLAESLGGHAVSRVDLQSGYVPYSFYGTASAVVAGDSSAIFWPAEPQA